MFGEKQSISWLLSYNSLMCMVFDVKCEVFLSKSTFYFIERECKIGLLIMILIFLSHENLRTMRIFLLFFSLHDIHMSKFHGNCSLLNSNSTIGI